jgi:succinate-semialdehyde dehydrogenase / glutarate-semialdehyde dehydrogenase
VTASLVELGHSPWPSGLRLRRQARRWTTARAEPRLIDMQAVNPTTGEVIRDYPELDAGAVDAAVAAAARAFEDWRRTPVAERARLLSGVADVLSQRKHQYAELMTLEMGKPITAAESEVDKCALTCRYYAERAAEFLRPEPVVTEASQSYVRFDPLGPVLAVMPWNFPFWQVFRFAAPALAAGNVGLLKHAGSVPGCALAIEEAFRSAGAPESVFSSLLIGSELVPRIIDNPAP